MGSTPKPPKSSPSSSQGGQYNKGLNRGAQPKFTHGDTVHFRLDFATGICEGRKGADGDWVKFGHDKAGEDFRGRTICPAVFSHGNRRGAVFVYCRIATPVSSAANAGPASTVLRCTRAVKPLRPLAIDNAQPLGGVARSAHNLPRGGDVLAGGPGTLVTAAGGAALALERGIVTAAVSALAIASGSKPHVSLNALPSRKLVSDDTVDECGAVAFVSPAPLASALSVICEGDESDVPVLLDSVDGGEHFRVVALDKRQLSAEAAAAAAAAAAPAAAGQTRKARQPLKPLVEALQAKHAPVPLAAAAALARRGIKTAVAWVEQRAVVLPRPPRAKPGARMLKDIFKKAAGDARFQDSGKFDMSSSFVSDAACS